AHVAAGIAVEYALCADAPGQLQIRSHVLAPPDREVVARFTEAGEAARELAIYDGAGVRRRRAGRWTPVPGTFYPAPSHVALGRLVVHARQPMGASCIAPGVLELMMHRSMTANDYRGLLQPLTDRTPVTVTHLLDLPQQEPADALRLAANHRANAPPLVFVLPAEHALPAAYAGAAQPAAAVRLVGIRARRAEAGPLQVDVRVAAHEPIDIPPAGLLRGAGQMAEAQGDWALCDLSAARRTFAPADRIRLAAGEQKLLRVAFSAQSASLIAAPLPPGTMARGRSPDLGPPITASVHSPSGP
ncbi:Alpha-mannosidase 2x, partial [Coemansia nantahalensis]